MIGKWIVVVAVSCGAVAHAQGQGPDVVVTVPKKAESAKVITLPEMIKLMEQSPRQYQLKSAERGEIEPEDTLHELYPLQSRAISYPKVVVTNGKRSLQEWKRNEKAQAALDRAEVPFQKKDYAKAAEIAEEATKIDPDDYSAWLYLGDCAFFAGDAKKGLELYDKAGKLNPYDYHVHFYRANALLRLGRVEEAKHSLARALALRPRYPGLVERIQKDSRLPFTLAWEPVLPRVSVKTKSDGAVVITTETDAPQWLAFGLCKAMWMNEPDYRKRVTGDTKHVLSSTEERECLAQTLAAYLTFRAKKEIPPDEGMEQSLQILKAGMLTELAVYELLSRSHEQVTLLLPEEGLDRLTTMIEKYLFVPR